VKRKNGEKSSLTSAPLNKDNEYSHGNIKLMNVVVSINARVDRVIMKVKGQKHPRAMVHVIDHRDGPTGRYRYIWEVYYCVKSFI
jgi:hypothetical protein